jgi:transposase
MSLYLVAGVRASTDAVSVDVHLPSSRSRRYPSDMTDEEWQVIAPLVPAGVPGRRGGRPARHSRRDIVDAIRYVAHNSCVWRALPSDFPPWKTVYDYHAKWAVDGTVDALHNGLRDQVRVAEGRQPEPSAALVDSQSVRAAETVARSSRGYDGGKKINGRKRHIATDTTGLLLVVLVTAASMQDRDGGRWLLWAISCCFPRISLVWADSGYAGQLVDWANHQLHLALVIVRKLAGQVGFQVHHRRWVVERTLSWISRCRRTVRDYERLPVHHAAFVQWSMIIVMGRRLARQT